MKIIIDNKIPYIEGALEPYAEVVYLPGNLTTREVVADADALITRTRTICNRGVLEGSKVKLLTTSNYKAFDLIESTSTDILFKEIYDFEFSDEEIEEWLRFNRLLDEDLNMLILDDDSDMLEWQKPYFVQTNFAEGFMQKHYEKALEILT